MFNIIKYNPKHEYVTDVKEKVYFTRERGLMDN